MEGLQQGPPAGEDSASFDETGTSFSIEEIELEPSQSTSLGDTQDAREDHGAADLKIGKSSLDVVFTEIIYGLYKARPACRIMMRFTVRSAADFRIKTAELRCIVGSDTTSKAQTSSTDIVRPSVLKTVPREMNDDHPTAVGITASIGFSPNVAVPGGPTVSVGNFIRQKTYTEETGWHLNSSVESSNGQKATSRDVGTWAFVANRVQKDAQIHSFEIEALFRHTGQPFCAIFQLEADLVFGAALRTIGKRKKVQTRRRFSPFETGIMFT
jgi:hypothetical protein